MNIFETICLDTILFGLTATVLLLVVGLAIVIKDLLE